VHVSSISGTRTKELESEPKNKDYNSYLRPENFSICSVRGSWSLNCMFEFAASEIMENLNSKH